MMVISLEFYIVDMGGTLYDHRLFTGYWRLNALRYHFVVLSGVCYYSLQVPGWDAYIACMYFTTSYVYVMGEMFDSVDMVRWAFVSEKF